MEDGQHVSAFGRAEGTSGGRPLRRQNRLGHRRGWWTQYRALPIEGSASHSQEITGGGDADDGGQMGDGIHPGFSSGSAFGRGHPNSAPTFLGTSMTISACAVPRSGVGSPDGVSASPLPGDCVWIWGRACAGQTLEDAGLPLATPGDQMRGVKIFAAQQGADSAGLCGGGASLGQDALLVLGREGSALGVSDNLRLRSRCGGRLGRDGEAGEIPLFFTLIPVLALLSNYDRGNCLINIGTEGSTVRFPPLPSLALSSG